MGKVLQLLHRRGGMVMIFDVANYIISLAKANEESFVTPLKLQKLCYYAQAWSMVWDDKPIFDEEFEAWAHGPANYDLYKKYEDRGYFPIYEIDEDFNANILSDEQKETIEAVWDAYGMYDGKYLENLTHEEDPWIIARGDCGLGERCNEVITLESMKEYYSKL